MPTPKRTASVKIYCDAISRRGVFSIASILNSATHDEISEALLTLNKYGSRGFHDAAMYQPARIFQAILSKASPEAISTAIVMKDGYGRTGLEMAAQYQTPSSFKDLLGLTSPDAISQALIASLADNGEDSLLKKILDHHSGENFETVLEKSSSYAICVSILQSSVRPTQKDIEMMSAKIPYVFELLKTPSEIKTHKNEFLQIHQILLDQLDKQTMSMNECIVWISYLNKALLNAPDEMTRNQISASCMRLNWIAYNQTEKVKNKESKRNKYRALALKHANSITSPESLSIDTNFLVYELLSARQASFSITKKQLIFLHQAVIDSEQSSKNGKIIDPTIFTQLSSILNTWDPQNENDQVDPNKDEWTPEDEAQFERVLDILKTDESSEMVLTMDDNLVPLVLKKEFPTEDENDQLFPDLRDVEEYISATESYIAQFSKEILPHCSKKEFANAQALQIKLKSEFNLVKNVVTFDPTKDEVETSINIFKDECLPKINKLIELTEPTLENEKTIAFLKNLALCIATTPFLVGIAYAGIWAHQYHKDRSHLFFTDKVIRKKDNLDKLKGLRDQVQHQKPRSK